ncbi:MAG: DUF3619 family protein [Comamonadaceae bacterium]|nr:DUF3619 family protein [Comamonadaceae bacterium]RRD57002.1 DUF3619 family protein [Comamonadaceae bacterium OH2545_COT-014]
MTAHCHCQHHRLHHPATADALRNRYALRVAARLSSGAQSLPPDISERLRAAREQALARRKPAARVATPWRKLALFLSRPTAADSADDALGFWGRLGSALVLAVMVAGLVTIHEMQDQGHTTELAALDAALLTDELPPAAYADPGFVQFLKTRHASGEGHVY